MVRPQWGSACRRNILCVDSYTDSILSGRFYGADHEVESFSSLMQFLSIMEAQTDEKSFAPPSSESEGASFRKGALATFEVQVLFQQHSSWQGILKWREKNEENSFRSALELIFLIDSALQTVK